MFSIGNDELEKKEKLGNLIFCENCGKKHIVKYGDEILQDGTKVQGKFIAFYKCGGKLYLAGINGRRI